MAAISGFLRKTRDHLISETTPAIMLGFARWVTGISVLYTFYFNFEYWVDYVPYFEYRNTYDGFHWIMPLASEHMQWLMYFALFITALFTVGLFYRFSAILTTLVYWYLFLLEKGNYNNHYYLYGLLLILFIFTDGRALSLSDLLSKRSPLRSVANWQLLTFKVQLASVYFFGGIAKLDIDWLQGYPMRFWLYDYGIKEHLQGTFFREFFTSEATAIVYSYGGLLFDLIIPIMLFIPRFRIWALPAIMFFHISNHFVFNIGSFPWTMMALTLMFFDGKKMLWFFRLRLTPANPHFNVGPLRRTLSIFFFVFWTSTQILIPLRQFVWKGHPSWTGQGNWFAWRMMLTDTVEGLSIRIMVPKDGVDFYVTLDSYMNYYQFNKAVRCPIIVLKFIDHLKQKLSENGVLDDAIIKLEMYKGVNFRPPSLFNDTTLNYATVPYEPWKSQDWILPQKRQIGEVKFNEDYYRNWVDFIKERNCSYQESLENN